jgi:DNA invertase Pin-like site-specific DNA recombinase
MAEGKFISYLRVSTVKQGRSGLGLEAQRQSIDNYLNGGKWKLLKEYVEIESGKNNDRPQLREALAACQRTRATLVIAKLDRLSRNVAFIANLMESGVDFVACDFPTANKLTVHILAAMAEYEREMISKRIKDALAAAKMRGVKLGKPENLNEKAARSGRVLGTAKRQRNAYEYARRFEPVISAYMKEGMSLKAIARKLSQDKELTPRGLTTWTPTTVRNMMKQAAAPRVGSADASTPTLKKGTRAHVR